MSQSVESLLFKHQDSSLDPQHSCKAVHSDALSMTPVTGQADTWYLLQQSIHLVCSGLSDPASKKVENRGGICPTLIFGLYTHVHTCPYPLYTKIKFK